MKKAFAASLLAAAVLLTSGVNSYADESKRIYGDVDRDGKITAVDSLYVLRTSVGLEKPSNDVKIAADVDNDGSITSADSLEILRYAVGLKTSSKTGKTITADNNVEEPYYGMVIDPEFNGMYPYDYPGYEDDFVWAWIEYTWTGHYWDISMIGHLNGTGEEFYKYTEEYFPYPKRDGKYNGETIKSTVYYVYLPS